MGLGDGMGAGEGRNWLGEGGTGGRGVRLEGQLEARVLEPLGTGASLLGAPAFLACGRASQGFGRVWGEYPFSSSLCWAPSCSCLGRVGTTVAQTWP